MSAAMEKRRADERMPTAVATEANECSITADTLGYIFASEEGMILNSGGALERDERVAKLIANMVRIVEQSPSNLMLSNSGITIQFDQHFYHVTTAPKKIVILLKNSVPVGPVEA